MEEDEDDDSGRKNDARPQPKPPPFFEGLVEGSRWRFSPDEPVNRPSVEDRSPPMPPDPPDDWDGQPGGALMQPSPPKLQMPRTDHFPSGQTNLTGTSLLPPSFPFPPEVASLPSGPDGHLDTDRSTAGGPSLPPTPRRPSPANTLFVQVAVSGASLSPLPPPRLPYRSPQCVTCQFRKVM